MPQRQGPLSGLKVIEFAGIGPAPACAALLADNGAQVVRIEGPRSADLGILRNERFDIGLRGRRRAHADLRNERDRAQFMTLVGKADMLIDSFRPGTAEKLGVGPEDCWRFNPKLVYGRLTGWGQTGPLAKKAGHGINYLAVTGALHAIGTRQHPVPPLNLVADMGGGTMFMAFGLLSAYVSAQLTGHGQVVDVAMTDCTIYLSMGLFGLLAENQLELQRESNLIDGGAPHYNCYETADGRYVAVGAVEERFFSIVLERLGLDAAFSKVLNDRSVWPHLKQRLAEAFKGRTRDEWVTHFANTDACVTPVLDWREAMSFPHNRARNAFVNLDGITQPAPAPRFSSTPGAIQGKPAEQIETLDALLADWD